MITALVGVGSAWGWNEAGRDADLMVALAIGALVVGSSNSPSCSRGWSPRSGTFAFR